MSRHATQAANHLLTKCWDLKIPVDLERVTSCLGARVEREPLLDVSGEVSVPPGATDPVIKVNSSDSPTRQRFTLAHELGHIALGHLAGGKVFRDPSKNYTITDYDPKERDANYFAAALLMPADAVKAYASSPDYPTVGALAKAFAVSEAAMKLRLKWLGIAPMWAWT